MRKHLTIKDRIMIIMQMELMEIVLVIQRVGVDACWVIRASNVLEVGVN